MSFTVLHVSRMGGNYIVSFARRALMLTSIYGEERNTSDENCCASKRRPKEMPNLYLSICYSILALIVEKPTPCPGVRSRSRREEEKSC